MITQLISTLVHFSTTPSPPSSADVIDVSPLTLTSTLSAVHRVPKESLCAALAVIALGGVLAGLVACRGLFTALAVPVALTVCKRRWTFIY